MFMLLFFQHFCRFESFQSKKLGKIININQNNNYFKEVIKQNINDLSVAHTEV